MLNDNTNKDVNLSFEAPFSSIDTVELTLFFVETMLEFDTLSAEEKEEKLYLFRIIAAMCRNLQSGQSF